MTYQIRITSRAYEDLREIVRCLSENHSIQQAAEWYDGILTKIESLASMPESHPFARENSRVTFELRELHFGFGSPTTQNTISYRRRYG